MKIKRTISIMLVLAMTLVMIPMTAQAATDGYYTYTVKDDVAIITDVDESISGDVVIPDKFVVDGIGEYPVTEIGEEAFEDCDNITSVVIPEGVTIIGSKAFQNCNALTDVTIPNTVTIIDDYTFDSTGLTSVIIPNSVLTIGSHAFASCQSLKEVAISNSVQTIDSYAFGNCSSLEFVTIPYSVNSVKERVFIDCTSLLQITIPKNLSQIPSGCFSGCTSLNDVTIEEGVYSIGGNAFSNCSSLEQITLPDSMLLIGDGAFSNTALKTINIPDTIIAIGDRAFYECHNLTEIVVPYNVTDSLYETFAYCSNLKHVTIFDCVEDLHSTFYGSNENLIIQCFDESYAEKYAEKHGFICKYITRDITDTATNITLSTAMESFHADDAFFSAVQLNEQINEITEDHTLYSMQYLVDGAASSQKYEMTFTIPVPQGYNGQSCKVYLIENGQKSAEIKTKYLSFEGVLEFSVENPNGTFAIVNESVPGDASSDGILNITDAILIAKNIIGYADAEIDSEAADVTGDGIVNIVDAITIVRYIVGHPVELL